MLASSVSVSSGGFDEEGGEWRLHYQKERAVNSSQWVNESVDINSELSTLFSESVETLLWILQAGAIPIFVVAFAFWWSREGEAVRFGR